MVLKIPSFDQLIETHVMCCLTEGKSRKTTEWYAANLKRFNEYLNKHELAVAVTEIGTAEARQFIFHLQNNAKRWENCINIHDDKNLSPFSVHGYVRTIKAFWSWLLVEGYIHNNPMAALKPPKTPQKITATFSQEQMQRLLCLLDRKTPRGFRDYTIILTLMDTGIRLSELINLDTDTIDFGQSRFLVNGKGGKERIVPFGSQVRRTLWRYLSAFRPEPESPRTNQLFLLDNGLPLKKRAVQSMLTRLGRRVGISGVRCSPHTFRHTFAKQYLMQGGDVFSLQRILGHSSLEVVKVYVNLASNEITELHGRFSPVDNMMPTSRKRSA